MLHCCAACTAALSIQHFITRRASNCGIKTSAEYIARIAKRFHVEDKHFAIQPPQGNPLIHTRLPSLERFLIYRIISLLLFSSCLLDLAKTRPLRSSTNPSLASCPPPAIHPTNDILLPQLRPRRHKQRRCMVGAVAVLLQRSDSCDSAETGTQAPNAPSSTMVGFSTCRKSVRPAQHRAPPAPGSHQGRRRHTASRTRAPPPRAASTQTLVGFLPRCERHLRRSRHQDPTGSRVGRVATSRGAAPRGPATR
jgi:hypothetical protein